MKNSLSGPCKKTAASPPVLVCGGGLVLGLALAAAGCQDYIFVQDPDIEEAVTKQIIENPTPPASDLLFVIDNSGSMAEEQDNLKKNFGFFIRKIAGAANDFQLGIVSTDMEDPTQSGRLLSQPIRKDTYLWVEEGLKEEGADLDGNGRVGDQVNLREVCADYFSSDREEGKPLPRILKAPKIRDLTNLRERACKQAILISEFKNNVVLGITGSTFEQPLEAMRKSLSTEGGLAENKGFLRDTGRLTIILLTDEEDCSHRKGQLKGEDGGECYKNPQFVFDEKAKTFVQQENPFSQYERLTPTNDYIRFLREEVKAFTPCNPENDKDCPADTKRKRDPNGADKVTMAAIIGAEARREPVDPDDPDGKTAIVESKAANCFSAFGQAAAGERVFEVVRAANSQNLVDSICQEDYRQTMEDIADLVNAQNCFTLSSPPPCPNFMTVTMSDGKETTVIPRSCKQKPEGWRYVRAQKAGERPRICFDGKASGDLEGKKLDVKFISDSPDCKDVDDSVLAECPVEEKPADKAPSGGADKNQ
ncbi:MAG: hypothetical protein GMKNLPBB_01384 [Myxococcota bacterium]|nr:hypothetical protein [Myxococcota bacterium]